MSPEIYQNLIPFDGESVDVWTAGVILFCLLTGNRSYARPHNSDAQFYWMTHGLSQLLQDWGIHISTECSHLLKNMLQIDARQRFNVEEILSHPWFNHDDVVPSFPVTQLDFNSQLNLYIFINFKKITRNTTKDQSFMCKHPYCVYTYLTHYTIHSVILQLLSSACVPGTV